MCDSFVRHVQQINLRSTFVAVYFFQDCRYSNPQNRLWVVYIYHGRNMTTNKRLFLCTCFTGKKATNGFLKNIKICFWTPNPCVPTKNIYHEEQVMNLIIVLS